MLSQGNRAIRSVLFGLKFADNIYYKLKSSHASKARLQGCKQNLTQLAIQVNQGHVFCT